MDQTDLKHNGKYYEFVQCHPVHQLALTKWKYFHESFFDIGSSPSQDNIGSSGRLTDTNTDFAANYFPECNTVHFPDLQQVMMTKEDMLADQ